mgnify:FL=1
MLRILSTSYELVNSFQVDENGLPYLEGEVQK